MVLAGAVATRLHPGGTLPPSPVMIPAGEAGHAGGRAVHRIGPGCPFRVGHGRRPGGCVRIVAERGEMGIAGDGVFRDESRPALPRAPMEPAPLKIEMNSARRWRAPPVAPVSSRATNASGGSFSGLGLKMAAFPYASVTAVNEPPKTTPASTGFVYPRWDRCQIRNFPITPHFLQAHTMHEGIIARVRR